MTLRSPSAAGRQHLTCDVLLVVVAVYVACSLANGFDNTNDMKIFEIVAEFAEAEPASEYGSVTWNYFALYVPKFGLEVVVAEVAEGQAAVEVVRVASGEAVA